MQNKSWDDRNDDFIFEDLEDSEVDHNFTKLHKPDKKKVPSLKLTASLHLKMDGWNTRFLLGWPIFRGRLLVSGSVPFCLEGFPD